MKTNKKNKIDKEHSFNLCYKEFVYINELVDWFNENKQYELVTITLAKNHETFFAIYKEFENKNI